MPSGSMDGTGRIAGGCLCCVHHPGYTTLPRVLPCPTLVHYPAQSTPPPLGYPALGTPPPLGYPALVYPAQTTRARNHPAQTTRARHYPALLYLVYPGYPALLYLVYPGYPAQTPPSCSGLSCPDTSSCSGLPCSGVPRLPCSVVLPARARRWRITAT